MKKMIAIVVTLGSIVCIAMMLIIAVEGIAIAIPTEVPSPSKYVPPLSCTSLEFCTFTHNYDALCGKWNLDYEVFEFYDPKTSRRMLDRVGTNGEIPRSISLDDMLDMPNHREYSVVCRVGE